QFAHPRHCTVLRATTGSFLGSLPHAVLFVSAAGGLRGAAKAFRSTTSANRSPHRRFLDRGRCRSHPLVGAGRRISESTWLGQDDRFGLGAVGCQSLLPSVDR